VLASSARRSIMRLGGSCERRNRRHPFGGHSTVQASALGRAAASPGARRRGLAVGGGYVLAVFLNITVTETESAGVPDRPARGLLGRAPGAAGVEHQLVKSCRVSLTCVLTTHPSRAGPQEAVHEHAAGRRVDTECPRRVDELVVTRSLPWQGEVDSGVLDRTGCDQVRDTHARSHAVGRPLGSGRQRWQRALQRRVVDRTARPPRSGRCRRG
jgi:hypothetical protein